MQLLVCLEMLHILTAIVLLLILSGWQQNVYRGRPPVTNLYSSALFIGWGAVLLCFFTENTFDLSCQGWDPWFGSLVIAHNLSLDSSLNPTGDTMEMMRAFLDLTWLATHVVITIGYSTTFLAGFWALPMFATACSFSFRKNRKIWTNDEFRKRWPNSWCNDWWIPVSLFSSV